MITNKCRLDRLTSRYLKFRFFSPYVKFGFNTCADRTMYIFFWKFQNNLRITLGFEFSFLRHGRETTMIVSYAEQTVARDSSQTMLHFLPFSNRKPRLWGPWNTGFIFVICLRSRHTRTGTITRNIFRRPPNNRTAMKIRPSENGQILFSTIVIGCRYVFFTWRFDRVLLGGGGDDVYALWFLSEIGFGRMDRIYGDRSRRHFYRRRVRSN